MSGVNAVQCAACGQWVPETTRFCGHCGTEVTPSVELFTDPNAPAPSSGSNPGAYPGSNPGMNPGMSGGGTGPVVYGSSIGSTPYVSEQTMSGPMSFPPGPTPPPGGGEHTIYTGAGSTPPSGPVVVVQHAPQPSGNGLKIAAIVLGCLILVVAIVLITLVATRPTPTSSATSSIGSNGGGGGAQNASDKPTSTPSTKGPVPSIAIVANPTSAQSGKTVELKLTASQSAEMKSTKVVVTGGPALEGSSFQNSFTWTAPPVSAPQDFVFTAEGETSDGQHANGSNSATVKVTPKSNIEEAVQKPIDDVYSAIERGDWGYVRSHFIVNNFREDGYNMIKGHFTVPKSATDNGDATYTVKTWVITNEEWTQGHVNTFPGAPGAQGGAGPKSGAICITFKVAPLAGTVTQLGAASLTYTPGSRTEAEAAAYVNQPC